jgi:hypothetical protein
MMIPFWLVVELERRGKIIKGKAERQILNFGGRFARLDLQPVLHWENELTFII